MSIFRLTAIATAGILAAANQGLAQSTVIQSGPSSNVVAIPTQNLPRTSLNSRQQRIELILQQSFPRRFTHVRTLSEMISECRRIGLPISVDHSAYEDLYDDRTRITGDISDSLPLYEMLENQLQSSNSTLALQGSRLRVISMDVASDPEYFTGIIYDVSSLVSNQLEFEEMIVATVSPDDWDETSGDGTISFHSAGGRVLMVVNQSYAIQREIRNRLQGLARLQGTGQLAKSGRQATFTESRIIQLPIASDFGPRIVGGRRNPSGRGGGIGGFGGGGGVF